MVIEKQRGGPERGLDHLTFAAKGNHLPGHASSLPAGPRRQTSTRAGTG